MTTAAKIEALHTEVLKVTRIAGRMAPGAAKDEWTAKAAELGRKLSKLKK